MARVKRGSGTGKNPDLEPELRAVDQCGDREILKSIHGGNGPNFSRPLRRCSSFSKTPEAEHRWSIA